MDTRFFSDEGTLDLKYQSLLFSIALCPRKKYTEKTLLASVR